MCLAVGFVLFCFHLCYKMNMRRLLVLEQSEACGVDLNTPEPEAQLSLDQLSPSPLHVAVTRH